VLFVERQVLARLRQRTFYGRAEASTALEELTKVAVIYRAIVVQALSPKLGHGLSPKLGQ